MEEGKIKIADYKKYKMISFENIDQIDLYNIREIVEVFQDGNEKGILDWIVDLSLINFLDSSAIGGLANQGLFLKKHSLRLILLSPHSNIRHLFSVTGFGKIFLVISSLEDLTD